MNPESTLLPELDKDRSDEDKAEADSFSLLILLDSRDQTLSSLEYAFSLAAAHRWHMHLIQLVDLDDFPSQINSPSTSPILATEFSRRSNRLEAFKEIIASSGVTVTLAETMMLSSRHLDSLERRVLQIAPDLVVVGRGLFNRKLLDEIVVQSCCPVMIVPETCRRTVSSSILLYAGDRQHHDHELFPFLRFADIARLNVSLVTVRDKKGLGTWTVTDFSPASTHAPITHYQIEGKRALVAIDEFLRKKPFGMMSVILRKHWRFWRLFDRCSYLDLAYKLSIPLLVFKAN